MPRPRVYVTGPIPSEVAAAVAKDFELLDQPVGAEGVLSLPSSRIERALFELAGPQLRIVANYGVGIDNIDLDAARVRGIVVANTPDVLTDATAEHAIALTLSLLRRVVEGDRFLRARGSWSSGLEFMLGRSLRGSRFLVVGPGRIGLATGRLASALGADVWFARRGEALLPLLATADVISLHVPLTPETRHLIDARAIAAMRGATALVNTARGAILDEEALAAALVEHRIAGAALDVFEDEPHVPKALLGLDNVVLTPHIGSGTRETRIRMGMLAVSALGDMLLRNRCPANAVD